MFGALRNEDEGPGGTHELAIFEVHDVLALENVESLCAVVMHMDRRAEARWLFGFQY